MGSPPSKIEAVVIKTLLDGEAIDAESFAQERKINRSTLGSILSILAGQGWISGERIRGKRTKTGGTTSMLYRAKEWKMLRVRLAELMGPPNYDFESVNRAMRFGEPRDIPSVLSFRLSVMEAKEGKDPTEVDYIPKYPK